ncbi:unnamed protein product [Peniophora sp. CBMAI 1063]|nr:unnamed protein product [Peniophora sp. CBMAI 1063]
MGKFQSPKSYRIARELGNLIQRLPGAYPFASLVYPWLATETSDTPNYTTAPDPTPAPPLSEESRVAEEIAELQRNRNFNDATYYRRLAELRGDQVRIAQQPARPRFTADFEREMRRNNTNTNPYGPNIRGPRPLRRDRCEPSMMDVDGASFSRPRPQPQPQRSNYAPARPCPSIIMQDSSFVIREQRERRARREGSIRVESTLLDPAAIEQAARDKEESDRIAAAHAQRMTEEFEKRVAAAEREKARLAEAARAEAARQAEAARLEEVRIAEEARKAREAAEAARLEEEARVAEEARKAQEAAELARQQAEREAEALRAAEAQRRAEEERARKAKDDFRARIQRESNAIRAEPDAIVRAFKIYEWKMQLVKTQSKELVDAGYVFDLSHLPWPMFEPTGTTATEVLDLNGGEPEEAIRAFVLHQQRPEGQGVVRKVLLKEVLRWHPDKMRLVMMPLVKAEDREQCDRLIQLTAGYLTTVYKTA